MKSAVLAVVLALCTTGAQAQSATAESDQWQVAQAAQDIVLLRQFVADHPQSPHLAAATALLAQSLAAAQRLGLMPVEALDSYPRQRALLAAARLAATAEAYQSYLSEFPDGLFVRLASREMALIPASVPPAKVEEAAAFAGLTFTTPFPSGEDIQGRSIKQIIAEGSPKFPPIEGLPTAVWQGKKCANCHAWTQEILCDQAKTYTAPEAAAALEKPHPMGKTFKIGLKAWAVGGCK